MAIRNVDPSVVLIGERRAWTRDLYHGFLLLSIPASIGVIIVAVLVINTAFALLYLWFGGVANAEPGSFLDAFSFSMQTLGTIGYGAMYPESPAAKIISDAEAVASLVVTAIATGLLFTRFARPQATLRFTPNVVIATMDGKPTLMFRVGNDRGNLIVEAQARLVMARTITTAEGEKFFRMTDLLLVRDRSINFTRAWTLMHIVDESSPLYGMNAASMEADEVEISASVVGIDDISLQQVHARMLWSGENIKFGYRLADLLRTLADGRIEADVRRFDMVVPED